MGERGFEDPDAIGPEAFPLMEDAAEEGFGRFRFQPAVDGDEVFFDQAVARMGDPEAEIAVVGE